MIIKRIEIVQAGICLGCVGLLFGFLSGILVMLFGLTTPSLGDHSGSAVWGRANHLYMLPLLYGAVSFITGSLGAALYNFVARLVGGIRINVEQ